MVRCILLIAVLISAAAHAAAPPAPRVMGRSWMVGDLTSDQVLVAEKADERIEPASLTKLMTAYLVFAALRDRKLTLEQPVAVSTRAWRAPGSRMFIEPRRPVTVDELIKGMEVQSGNDACIALAEAVAGSEEVFVQLMNREAARLGMANSHFMNATGLPDAQHYSTALEVWKGAANGVRAGSKGDLYVTVPKGEAPKLKAELVSQRPLIAPIAQGQQVGTLRVALDGKPFAEYPLIALETVGPAGIFGRAWDTLRLWIK